MGLDKYEKVALLFSTIGICCLSIMLLGWQAVLIALCIAAAIAGHAHKVVFERARRSGGGGTAGAAAAAMGIAPKSFR